jgi:GDP-4-dehydro-6-deoxy-D-mannose reductase
MSSASSPHIRILVTGADGFVGRHLTAALAALPEHHEIIAGIYRSKVSEPTRNTRYIQFDVTDPDQVHSVIGTEQPTHLFHLAGIAAPSEAERHIRKAWAVNFEGTLNVALAVAETAKQCRVIFCSSAEVYGDSFRSGQPLSEEAALDPANVYGVSKAAADLMIGQMAKQRLRAIRLRPFNHTGPGQSELFVVPAFASQIAAIERGEQEPLIRVGTLTDRRDFLDVRDVVNAYVHAILRFDNLPNGCVLNIATGSAISIAEILKIMLSLSSKKIQIAQDPARIRKSSTPIVSGNADAARRLLGWAPRVEIAATLASVLNWCRQVRSVNCPA